jgi:hypothetical protein
MNERRKKLLSLLHHSSNSYLIYANGTSQGLFIHPDSRTMLVDGQSWMDDLVRLTSSETRQIVSDIHIPVWLALPSVLIVALAVSALKRRQMRNVKSLEFLAVPVVALALLSVSCVYPQSDQFRFAKAAVTGDLSTVRRLIKSPAVDVNSSNPPLGPALVSSAYGGQSCRNCDSLVGKWS